MGSEVSESDEDPDKPKPKPAPGKKTRGRVKIPMKYIKNKLRRYTTFSKRKSNIMKKAYELSTLTGTQVGECVCECGGVLAAVCKLFNSLNIGK